MDYAKILEVEGSKLWKLKARVAKCDLATFEVQSVTNLSLFSFFFFCALNSPKIWNKKKKSILPPLNRREVTRSTPKTSEAVAGVREEGIAEKDYVELQIATESSKEEHKLGIGIATKLNGAQPKAEWTLVERSSY